MTDLDLYTLEQVGVILGRSERWVRDRIRAGDLSHVVVGNSLRLTEEQVREYITRNSRDIAPVININAHGRRTRARR